MLLTNRLISSSCSGFNLLCPRVRFVWKIKLRSGGGLNPGVKIWRSLVWLLLVMAGLKTDVVDACCSFFSWRFLLKRRRRNKKIKIWSWLNYFIKIWFTKTILTTCTVPQAQHNPASCPLCNTSWVYMLDTSASCTCLSHNCLHTCRDILKFYFVWSISERTLCIPHKRVHCSDSQKHGHHTQGKVHRWASVADESQWHYLLVMNPGNNFFSLKTMGHITKK